MRRTGVAILTMAAALGAVAVAGPAASNGPTGGPPGGPAAPASGRPLPAVGSVADAVAGLRNGAVAQTSSVGPVETAASVAGPDRSVDVPLQAVRDLVVEPTTGRVFVAGDDRVAVFAADGEPLGVVAGLLFPRALATAGGIVYVAESSGARIGRIDAATLTALSPLALPGSASPVQVAVARGVVWYVDGPLLVGIDPVTAAPVTSVPHQALVYEGRLLLEAVPDGDRWLIGGTPSVSPFHTFSVDLATTPPTVVPSCATPVDAGNGAALAPLPGGAGFVLASGYPYHFPVVSVATQCPTGFAYASGPYPSTVAATGAGGGVVAGGLRAPYGPDILLYRIGSAAPFRSFEIGALDLHGASAFSPDGLRFYALAAQSTALTPPQHLLVVGVDDLAPPTVTRLDPPFGTSVGGGDVTITGTDLRTVDRVTFGGVPSSAVTLVNATTVIARAPALTPGEHAVEVRTGRGTSAPAPAATFYVSRDLGSLGEFTATAPTRLLDTRTGTGAPAGKVAPGAVVDLTVLGRPGVPARGVAAVVLNVTVTDPSSAGFLTVYPSGGARPLASNLNFAPGQTVPNLVVARVGDGGRVSFFNSSGSSHVVADLAGWYATADGPAGSRFHPIAPVRVIDTRENQRPLGPNSWGWIDLLEGADPSVRASVSAWVLNVTVTEGTAPSYLTVYPYGNDVPLASNLNLAAGQTVANLVVVSATDGGMISFFNAAGQVHVVADVVGWYDDVRIGDAGRFVPLDQPARRVDTRSGGTLGPAGSTKIALADTVGLPPAPYMDGVVANVTATGATAATFVTVYPGGTERPLASNLNLGAGETVPNLVVAATGASGGVVAFNWAGSVDLVADIVGWFTSPFGGFAFD